MRRLWIPLLASVALHLGLLALRPKAPPPAQPVRDAIELDFVEDVPRLPTPELEKRVTPKASSGAASTAVSKSAPKVVAPQAANAPITAPREGAQDGTEKRLASDVPLRDFNAPKPPEPKKGSDAPKLDLPSDRVLSWTPSPAAPGPAEEEHGHLIHNRPEELPDPEVVAAYEREQAKAKVQGFLEHGFASQRVNNGLVSSYFTELRHGLEKSTEHPPLFIEPFSLTHLDRWAKQHAELDLTAYKAAAQKYGATGTPYLTPEALPQGEIPGALQRELDRGSTQAREFAQTLQVGARIRDFGNGKMGAELVAVVELRQAASGALLGSLLVQSSGNKLFDSWVMGQAIEGVGLAAEPPDAGLGIHPDGLRSVWAFAGKVVYKRSLNEAKLKDDWWYLLGALATSTLVGNFEETTGKVEYIDLRHPSFECRVSLLQVY